MPIFLILPFQSLAADTQAVVGKTLVIGVAADSRPISVISAWAAVPGSIGRV